MVNIITNYECNKSCDFCFQKDIKSDSMLSLEDFRKIIEWADQFKFFQTNEQRKVSIMGGEPTINPKLGEMIQYLKRRYVKAIIFTNFVFNKKKIELFDPKVVQGFVGTYNPQSFYRKDEYKIVENNISELKKRGFEVKLSYNVTRNNLDYQYILDACEKHKLSEVRFSTAFPNPKFNNNYLNFEELKEVGDVINNFVRDAVKRKIKLFLDCTIPLCILGSEKNILFFFKHVHMGSQICKSTADVNPDLSMCYCMPLSEKVKVKRIFDFKQMQDLNNHFEDLNNESRNQTYTFKECIDCKYRIRNLCQGGCLALKRKFNYKIENIENKVHYIETWGGIGDGLMTIPIFKSLKEKNPNCKIYVLANENHKPLFINNPYIDKISISPDRSVIDEKATVKKTNYGRLKPSINYKEHAIDIIAGMVGTTLKDKRPNVFLTEKELDDAKKNLKEFKNPIIMQITSKASANQHWPKKNWEELIKSMPEFTFIQVGSKNEEPIKGAVDFRGETSVRESIALLSLARTFVGVVSFMAHATAAVNKPSVILFGPSNPKTWGYEQNINIYKNLDCAPCIDTLGKGKCPHKNKCMNNITIKEVKNSLLKITQNLK